MLFSKFNLGFYTIFTFLYYANSNEKVPHIKQATNSWYGRLDVSWDAENEEGLNYTVFYKPNIEQDTSWNQVTVTKKEVTLNDLQAQTNYSLKVSIYAGSTKYVSPIHSVFVREGIPRTPFDLKYSFHTKFEGGLLLEWRMNDPYREIIRYEVSVFQGNETRLSIAHRTDFLLDDIYPENGDLLINVFAINKRNKSQPASLLITESSYELTQNEDLNEIDTRNLYPAITEKETSNKPKVLLYSIIAGATVFFIMIVCLIVIKIRKRSAKAHHKMSEESSNSGITCYEFPPNDMNRKQNGLLQTKGLLKMSNSLDSSVQIGINLSHNQHVVYDSNYSYNSKNSDFLENKYCIYDPHPQNFDSNVPNYQYSGSNPPHNVQENIYDLPITDNKNTLEHDNHKQSVCNGQYNDKGYYSPPNHVIYNTNHNHHGVPSSSIDCNHHLLNDYQNNSQICANNTLVDVSKYKIHNDV